MIHSTRRDFLATTSLAALGLACGPRLLDAQILPLSMVRPSDTASTFLEEQTTPDELRRLALHAVDAAKSAGAKYADVRVSEQCELFVESGFVGAPLLLVQSQYMFSVRASAGGPMAFVHGSNPSPDAVAIAAQQAVAKARGYATLAAKDFVFAQTPVVTGEWTTPIKIDPFAVPILAQVGLLQGLLNGAAQVLGITSNTGGSFSWFRDIRTFASTEGSLITQTQYRSRPRVITVVQATIFGGAGVEPANFPNVSGGYESVLLPDLPEQVKAAAEESRWLSSLPTRQFEVGRVPVTLDGCAAGAFFSQTIGRALEVDLSFGLEGDATGTTFLSPPREILGNLILNPLLNVTGNRAVPSAMAAQWDDEGVVPQEVTFLKEGRVMDYATSRATAPLLGAWYESQGKPVRSNGSAFSDLVENPQQIRVPHLHIEPSQSTMHLEDMYREVSHGILVTGPLVLSTDPTLATGTSNVAELLEIKRGKIVSRLTENALIFNTKGFWKNLVALGDKSTLLDYDGAAWKGNPWRSGWQAATAPAMRFNAIDVISTARSVS